MQIWGAPQALVDRMPGATARRGRLGHPRDAEAAVRRSRRGPHGPHREEALIALDSIS